MNELDALRRITTFVALAGAVAAAVAWAAAGTVAGASTGVGAILAVVNWEGFVRIASAMADGSLRRRALLALALAVKIALLVAAVWVLVTRLGARPAPFAAGLSAMVVGIVAGAARIAATQAWETK